MEGRGVSHTTPGVPGAKVIERQFRSIQERKRPQAAFVGFNHREYGPERLNKLVRQVKDGLHPQEFCHSLTAFRDLLDAELMSFAREPQNGSWLDGASPLEAWQHGIGGKPGVMARPLRKLPEEKRYLLATHAREFVVSDRGLIQFEAQGKKLLFWDERTAGLRGRTLLTRWNLEEPKLLHCLPAGGEAFTLTARELPSSTATKEELAGARRDRAAVMNRSKALYDNLPHPFRASIQRDAEVSPESTRAAKEIAEATEARRKTEAEDKRQAALVRAYDIPEDHPDPEGAIAAIERRKAREAQFVAEGRL